MAVSEDAPPVVDLRRVGALPRRRRAFSTRRQRVVAGAVIIAALGSLLWKGLSGSLDYYLTADQAVAQRAQLGQSDFRIQGTVVAGLRQTGAALNFAIVSHHVQVQVVSTGTPPQLFRPGMPVVLEGHWQGNVFSSYQIMVQHGSNYVEARTAPIKTKAEASEAKGDQG